MDSVVDVEETSEVLAWKTTIKFNSNTTLVTEAVLDNDLVKTCKLYFPTQEGWFVELFLQGYRHLEQE